MKSTIIDERILKKAASQFKQTNFDDFVQIVSEVIFQETFPESKKEDFLIYKEKKIKVIPTFNRWAVVYDKEDLDYFYFLFHEGDLVRHVGFIKKEDFFDKATHYPEGSLDPLNNLVTKNSYYVRVL